MSLAANLWQRSHELDRAAASCLPRLACAYKQSNIVQPGSDLIVINKKVV